MISPTKLALCISADDYAVFAGPDWPSYRDFLNGRTSDNPEIHKEIQQFTQQMVGQGIHFPIRTATSCQSKWTWSTIYLNNLSTASCHRVRPVHFSIEDFDNFHNIPKKIADRELMLNGQWPTGGCEYCRDIEQAGGWSDRQHNLDIRDLTPPELETNPTATSVTPRVVEIFAQNVCNLSCTYCNASLSSKIEQENIKYGEFNQGGVVIPVLDKPAQAAREYFEKWLAWLEKNIHHLRRLHLLGGETFIQHELMNRVLDIIERKPNSELTLCVFSNLNVPDRYWDLYIGRIKDLQKTGNIKTFDLTASIDCWGPEQEYARSGLDLEKFEQRFAWAVKQGDWLRLHANQTVTALTVRTMSDLVKKIDYYSQYKHIGHYFQFYTGVHMFQHPQTFAWSMWEHDFEKVLAAMPTRTDAQREAVPRMQGLIAQLKQKNQHNWEDVRKLHIYLDELDRRRNTDWRKLFGYLDIHEQA